MNVMTIEECRSRKRTFKRLIRQIDDGANYGIERRDMNAIRLALVRSVVTEELNIKALQKEAKHE